MESASAVSMASSWCRRPEAQLRASIRSSSRRRRLLRIGASAASRDDESFEGRARVAAGRVREKAQEVWEEIGRRAGDLRSDKELEARVRRMSRAANQRLEELGYEVKRRAVRMNREYRISDQAQEFAEGVRERVQAADSRYRVRQKARAFTMDVRMKLPTYRRQLVNFLDTPLGKLVSTVFLAWFVLSGWIFRVFVLSMWLLPIAAPLLIGTVARNALVEGTCPSCKTQFIGSRSQVVVCRNCRNVVWQPREDFSSSNSKAEDPSIIDIDVDKD